MSRSLKVFTLFGTPVHVNYTWPIAPTFITVALGAWGSADLDSAWLTALVYGTSAVIALCLAASVLLHEFAHVLIARRLGISTSGITLFALGGVSHIEEDEAGPGRELAVSIAGPLASIGLGVAFYAVSLPLTALVALLSTVSCPDAFYATSGSTPAPITYACSGGPTFLALPFFYIAIANIVIGLFNLLPLFPLDGGRILSAILWAITSNRQRGIRIAALLGQLGAAAMIVYGAYNLFFGELLIGVWFIAIGVFLMEAAVGASEPRSVEETRAMS